MAHDSDAVLHIQLLGNFRLVYDDQPVTSIEAPRLQALLAYLLLHRDAPQSRQHIAFLLYPDSSEAQARTNLRNQMHYLRKALPAADRFLIADAQTLQWNSDAPFTLDVDDFENSVAHASSSATLREAVNLYRDELLPGCYDDWILPEREQLRQKFVETLERLILLLENQRDFHTAVSFTERLLRQDPLREETYRHLMRLYVLSGDSAGARRVYQTCVAVLKRELDAEPSRETRAEFERLFNQAAAAEKSASAYSVRSDIPPPKTTHTPPNNLPVQLTSFIGREQQIADLKRLLSLQNISSRTRLVTFTGAGGSGKTRLAIQVAHELLPSFQDGAWFVDLAPLADPALIPQAIASALSVHEQPGRALLDTLLDSLRGKELLLLLDNCEQFVAACAELVQTLLEKCPRVQIIATSRERLNLAGETVWLVPTLSLPDADDGAWIDASHSEAVRLFIERALSALPTFALTRQNTIAVA